MYLLTYLLTWPPRAAGVIKEPYHITDAKRAAVSGANGRIDSFIWVVISSLQWKRPSASALAAGG